MSKTRTPFKDRSENDQFDIGIKWVGRFLILIGFLLILAIANLSEHPPQETTEEGKTHYPDK